MSPTLTIALLQLRASDLADHEQAWAELLRRIDDAAEESPRLIVAPEAAYPAALLGSRETFARQSLRSDAEVLSVLGDRARRHGCYIATGLVLRDPFGIPQNAAVLIAPGGAVIARATEQAPAPWFAPGAGPATATVDEVPVALFAGNEIADADRVAAAVAATGARLLIATGAGTAWGRTADRLPEPSAHRALAARALECGAWAVAPAKVGVEAASRVYAGRAGVVSPLGAWVVRAPADRPGVVLHTIDLEAAAGPPVPLLPSAPTQGIERATADTPPIAAIAVARTPSAVDLMEALRALVRTAAAQGARLLVLPDLAGAETRAITADESLPLLEALAAETGTILAVALAEREGGVTYKTAYLIDRGATVAAHRQSVLSAEERAAGFTAGDMPPPVIATAAGAIGLLCGVEALQPALAADLAARGAEALVWCAGAEGAPVEPLARVRAIETRCPVAAAGTNTPGGGACIVDDAGNVLAISLDGRAMTVLATVERAGAPR